MATESLKLWTRESQTLAPKPSEVKEAEDDKLRLKPDLETSRRLAWRFLLPNPHLGRVAYLGPASGTLPRALREFCDSLTTIAPARPAVHAADSAPVFDLVVLRSQSQADAEKASTLLESRGSLYWEIDPANWLNTWRGVLRRDRQKERWSLHLNLVRDCIVLLQRLGLCDIEVYWHRPNFERCSEIIPVNDPLALEYIFSRDRNALVAQLQLAVEWWMIKTGLLPHFVPCISLIAFKRLPTF